MGRTTANVDNIIINVLIAWIGHFFQQGGSRHHKARLAIAALRDDLFYPGLLYRVQIIAGGKPFYSGNVFAFRKLCSERAGSHRFSVDVDGAGAASRFPAAKLGPL